MADDERYTHERYKERIDDLYILVDRRIKRELRENTGISDWIVASSTLYWLVVIKTTLRCVTQYFSLENYHDRISNSRLRVLFFLRDNIDRGWFVGRVFAERSTEKLYRGYHSNLGHATVFLLQMIEQIELHWHDAVAKGTRVQNSTALLSHVPI